MRRALTIWLFGGLTLTAWPLAAQTPSVGELAQSLTDQNPAVRLKAADGLSGAEGDDAAKAAAALGAALADANEEVRWHSARSLARLGAPAAVAVPALSQALSDKNLMVRAHAALALGAIGRAAQPAAPALLQHVVDPDPGVRRAALHALRSLGLSRPQLLPKLAEVLGKADPATASMAVQTIVESGPAAVPALQAALKDPQARYWALLGVSDLGPVAADTAPQIVAILQDPSAKPHVIVQALASLGEIGPKAALAEPQVLKILSGDQRWAQYPAVLVAGRAGLKSAVPALRKLAQDKDPLLSSMALWAMARCEPQNVELTKHAFARLTANLTKTGDRRLQLVSARALGELTVPPELITVEVIDVVRGLDPEVHLALAESIAARGEAVVPRLTAALGQPNGRDFALGILSRLGPQAKAAVPAIVKAAQDNADEQFAREAAFALAAIGPDAAPATEYLIGLIRKGAPPLQYAGSYALGRIGPGAAAAAPVLRGLLTSDDAFLRTAAAWALLKIDPAKNADVQAQAVGLFTAALADERPEVRVTMAQALAEQGPAAKAAAPALQKALHDSHQSVREAAAEALEKIDVNR
ncbi:MAG: HEAT repeat domain-containing protein [Pirellulales bacterium]